MHSFYVEKRSENEKVLYIELVLRTLKDEKQNPLIRAHKSFKKKK